MTATARLRSWFLRNLLEAAERELGTAALAGLVERAPARVRPHLSLDRLRATAALDAIPLDEGEDTLLAIDQGLGDGTGRVLERLAREMFSRQLVQAAAAVRVGDLYGTVARLRGPLEHPFLDTEITFELEKNDAGFALVVGVPGRPRATRLLRHLAIGAILAAERFARESQAEPLKIQGEAFADRARIEAQFRRVSERPPDFEPPTSMRRSSGASRIGPSLSEEVARILDPTLALGRTRDEQKEPSKRHISSDEIEAVKVPAQSGAALGPATPLSQRRPTLPPAPPTAEPTQSKEKKTVDPRGVTLPAIEQARLKPPKA